MRMSVNQKGYTLSYLSAKELNVVMFLLGQIRKQCFCDCDYDRETGRYYDGGSFTAAIGEEERDALYGFVDGFWREYDRVAENLKQTSRKRRED